MTKKALIAAAMFGMVGGAHAASIDQLVTAAGGPKVQEAIAAPAAGFGAVKRVGVKLGKQITYISYIYDSKENAAAVQTVIADKFKRSGINILNSEIRQEDGKFRAAITYLADTSVISQEVYRSNVYRDESTARSDMADTVAELKGKGCRVKSAKITESLDAGGFLYAYRIDYTKETPDPFTLTYTSEHTYPIGEIAQAVKQITDTLSAKGMVVIETDNVANPSVTVIAKNINVRSDYMAGCIKTADAVQLAIPQIVAGLKSRGASILEAYPTSGWFPQAIVVYIPGDNMPDPISVDNISSMPEQELAEIVEQLKAADATILDTFAGGNLYQIKYIPAK